MQEKCATNGLVNLLNPSTRSDDPIVRFAARIGAGLGVERQCRNQLRVASLAARVSAIGDGVAGERFRRPVAAARLPLIGLGLRGV